MIATARIATIENNYIVAIPKSYNEPHFFFVKKNMKTIIREASASEWLWATTEWESNLERGEWEIGNNDYFAKKTKLRNERREKAFSLFKDPEKCVTSVIQNDITKVYKEVNFLRSPTEEEIEIIREAADASDSWSILNSVGGSCGKNYNYECDLFDEDNYTFIDVVVSRGSITKGFTAYILQD